MFKEIKEFIEKHLEENNFDGLKSIHDNGEIACCCEKNNLIPCIDRCFVDCRPFKIKDCDPKNCGLEDICCFHPERIISENKNISDFPDDPKNDIKF